MDLSTRFIKELQESPPGTPADLAKRKNQFARRTGTPLLRNDELLQKAKPGQRIWRALTLNSIRSRSGISALTVLTEPFPCPGRCVFCPTEARVPKSYLPSEPAVQRAIRVKFDPYRQVKERLKALLNTGHAADKIELIVKGGTWSFYPEDYQRRFIQRCFEAANSSEGETTFPPSDGRGQSPASLRSAKRPASPFLEEQTHLLLEAQRRNETARHRIIGLTVETRPDYVTQEEILRLRNLGVTRVELGVQSLEDRILELSVRDHTTREVAVATQLLRDAGFKVAYHMMPNLPGATVEDDLNTFDRLFGDPAFRPDAIKIYPCLVLESAELHRWWKQGRYQPLDGEALLELVMRLKLKVPPTVRIERIAREIPASEDPLRLQRTNLRQQVAARMKAQGLRCRCIRCRQVQEEGQGEFLLFRRDVEASGGREIFLSFESRKDRLAALLRLRIPSQIFSGKPHWIPALEKAAVVRELHTYGWQVPIRSKAWLSLEEAKPLRPPASQHRGFGKRLMQEGERIAREEFGLRRIAVISGVGVREYYRRIGYRDEATYLVKELC